jgi:CRP-like cAMP-binding protein
MARMLIRQLERFVNLSLEEKLALRGAGTPPRRFPAHHDLAREDEPVGTINMLMAGFACRYVVLPNGRRQILAYLLPGDFCDLRACILERMDHSIGTLTAVKLASFSRASIADLSRRFPQIARALALATVAEEATARQWLLNLGHRTALERAAHLFCELFTRLRAVGLTTETSCELPLTQTDLADALALSPVHMNRTLMEMRRNKMMTFVRHQLVINDFQALERAAGFRSRYLHSERQRSFFCEMRTAIEVQALAGLSRETPAEVPAAVRQDAPVMLSPAPLEQREQVGGAPASDSELRAGAV